MSVDEYVRALSAVADQSVYGPVLEPGTLIATDPIEPFARISSVVWIKSAAFHAESLRHHCGNMVDEMRNLWADVRCLETSASRFDDLFWDAFSDARVDDLRFHATVYLLYAELIRSNVLDDVSGLSVSLRCIRPSGGAFDANDTISHRELVLLLSERFSLTDVEPAHIATDLLDLGNSVTATSVALEAFHHSELIKGVELLARFANSHAAVLWLLANLLRADVSLRMLLSATCD
ncbi:MAG: hypothetical protein GX139_07280 [Armatimonadetes bacterium]|jgi:hypothetical protein|nr:hypothetical protein [Armatimonadota bacterium]